MLLFFNFFNIVQSKENFILFLLASLRCNLHTISFTNFKCIIDEFWQMYKVMYSHRSHDTEYFHHLISSFVFFCSQFSSHPVAPGNYISALCHYCLAFLEFHINGSYSTQFLYMASFRLYLYLHHVLYYCQVVVHCMAIPKFVYSVY